MSRKIGKLFMAQVVSSENRRALFKARMGNDRRVSNPSPSHALHPESYRLSGLFGSNNFRYDPWPLPPVSFATANSHGPLNRPKPKELSDPPDSTFDLI